MGQGASKRNVCSKEEGTRVLFTGLYNDGKAALVQKLRSDGSEFVSSNFSIEKGKRKNLIFQSWDLSGRSVDRPLLQYYFRIFDAIVYMVDSSERVPFEHGLFMKDMLQSILREREMVKLPVLVLANKQDLPGALTCQQVAEELGLSQISSDRSVEILPLSLETGEGLPELREWLEHLERAKLLHETIIKPLEKAVPPTVKTSYSKMSSALKQAFGKVKSKLSPSS